MEDKEKHFIIAFAGAPVASPSSTDFICQQYIHYFSSLVETSETIIHVFNILIQS